MPMPNIPCKSEMKESSIVQETFWNRKRNMWHNIMSILLEQEGERHHEVDLWVGRKSLLIVCTHKNTREKRGCARRCDGTSTNVYTHNFSIFGR
mmetsp:Transcript_22970/g.30039  ORF Transcript_22970/g.30039 Transcript_22970/m.30039 type:complete len:94 (-) Transcript_22970:453-734(-)